MTSKYQNRLVGTLILLLIGVIILPVLLDGKKTHYKEELAEIPLIPKSIYPLVENTIPRMGMPSLVHQPIQPTTQKVPLNHKLMEQLQWVEKSKTVETQKQSELKITAAQSYVVQLGALKNATKANKLVAKLRLSGYPAFTVPLMPIQGQFTRIYVGPNPSKAQLQSLLYALKDISGLGGIVKPYSTN